MKALNNYHYDQILQELWHIRNPHMRLNMRDYKKFKEKIIVSPIDNRKKKNINLPSKKAFFELTTARNRNLINIEEQNKLRKTDVAFFGLSVGSHAALTWMMESRAETIKIIDPDVISATNLNRLRTGWDMIGEYKVNSVKEILQGINPYCKIEVFTKGSQQEIHKIFASNPPINVIVDEVDDFEAKILFRKLAKEKRIPLISAADVGDNVILDIERYDIDPQPELFLGRVPDAEKFDFTQLSPQEKKKLIINLIGFNKNSERMIDSLFSIGGSIVTWPQLGATATMAGGIVATTIKKIILEEKVVSGRYYISLDDILVKDFNSLNRKKTREKKITQIQSLIK